MSAAATPDIAAPRARIEAPDIIRGAVMVLMAIDHVRVYSGIPAGGPTAGVFFTRWVTHFCAPAFVFLAGTGAFLYGRKMSCRLKAEATNTQNEKVLSSPAPEGAPPALFRLLNQPKYPASQLFLLMTLGPAIALLPLAERARGWVAGVLATFGRVPMFYYLLHIPVIHATALAVWLLRDGSVHAEWFASAPFVSIPPEQGWGLPLLYLVFGIVVAILYVPCRWFARVKARQHKGWLRYL